MAQGWAGWQTNWAKQQSLSTRTFLDLRRALVRKSQQGACLVHTATPSGHCGLVSVMRKSLASVRCTDTIVGTQFCAVSGCVSSSVLASPLSPPTVCLLSSGPCREAGVWPSRRQVCCLHEGTATHVRGILTSRREPIYMYSIQFQVEGVLHSGLCVS